MGDYMDAEATTTIAVKKSTILVLKSLQEYPRESYDETINKIAVLASASAKERKEQARKKFLETIGKGYDLGLKGKLYKNRGELYDR